MTSELSRDAQTERILKAFDRCVFEVGGLIDEVWDEPWFDDWVAELPFSPATASRLRATFLVSERVDNPWRALLGNLNEDGRAAR